MIARLLVLAMLLGCVDAAASERTVSGTYHLRICGPSCAHGKALLEGSLVLLDVPVRDASGAPLVVGTPQPVNGCFRLGRVRPHGMIGGQRGGYVIWSRARDRVFVNFTPDGVDAFYTVDFHAVADGMAGTGISVYDSEPRPAALPADAVRARRIGAADAPMCAPARIEPLRRMSCASPPLLCVEAGEGARSRPARTPQRPHRRLPPPGRFAKVGGMLR